jgi:hypothetical protein
MISIAKARLRLTFPEKSLTHFLFLYKGQLALYEPGASSRERLPQRRANAAYGAPSLHCR